MEDVFQLDLRRREEGSGRVAVLKSDEVRDLFGAGAPEDVLQNLGKRGVFVGGIGVLVR